MRLVNIAQVIGCVYFGFNEEISRFKEIIIETNNLKPKNYYFNYRFSLVID